MTIKRDRRDYDTTIIIIMTMNFAVCVCGGSGLRKGQQEEETDVKRREDGP